MHRALESNSHPPAILVTGAAGYIGSHTVLQMLLSGFRIVAVDNHCNSSPAVYERIRALAGSHAKQLLATHQLDICNTTELARVCQAFDIEACVHFAALKAVGQSQEQPLKYLNNNLAGLLSLLTVMEAKGIQKLVYSSSATVYGAESDSPILETSSRSFNSVYGYTKLAGEQFLEILTRTQPTNWHVATLRYFNPVGAHPSGEMGEMPSGKPNNLMPYITQVARGLRPYLEIFGNDYPTPDGTCIRDYLHVQDLARGHVLALQRLFESEDSFTVNFGTGKGTSVLELVRTFEDATGITIPTRIGPRRSGDVPVCFADAGRALELLGWHAEFNIEQMCRDAWNWQHHNPEGYA